MPNRSDSRRVRGSDVRAVLRLVREACELGEDALAWRSHVLEGLDPLSRPVQLPGLFRFLKKRRFAGLLRLRWPRG